ncbi:MAG: HAD family hydrolase [Alistipes sp.]
MVSIPLGYFGGIGAASRQGILFKGGNFLDVVTRLGTVLFDKTGTLTEGTFEVREVHTAPEVSERKLLETLAALESRSTHPIARAVVRYAENRGAAVARGADTTEHPTGRGAAVWQERPPPATPGCPRAGRRIPAEPTRRRNPVLAA